MGTLNIDRCRGTIHVGAGPMGSAKSRQLILDIHGVSDPRYSPRTQAIAFNSAKHKRDGDSVIASRYRNGDGTAKLSYPATQVGDVNDIPRIVMERELASGKRIDVVGIDEGHFFGEDLVPVAMHLAYAGKAVLIAMLDADFRKRQYGAFTHFNGLNDGKKVRVDMHEANCLMVPDGEEEICGAPAPYTARLLEGCGNNTCYVDYLDTRVSGLGFAPYFHPTDLSDGTKGVVYIASCGDHHDVPYKEDVDSVKAVIERSPGIKISSLKRAVTLNGGGLFESILAFLVKEGQVVQHGNGEQSLEDRLQIKI